MHKNVVIAGYARSPFHFAKKGDLKRVRPDEMAAQVVRGLVEKTGVEPNDIEDLIVGCAFPEADQGFNVARLIGFLADLPRSVAGTTVNRFCGSSMQSIHMAAGAIQMNAGEAFICAGVESMSRVPMTGFNPMIHPALAENYPQAYMPMGETAENVASKYDISRERQEELAVDSHRKAAEAQREGRLSDEIIPIVQGNHSVDSDGCVRPETTPETLAGLKPAFRADGIVTAGTSSPLTDGAAAVLVCTEDYRQGATTSMVISRKLKSIAVAGCRAGDHGHTAPWSPPEEGARAGWTQDGRYRRRSS